jgi:crossover junction endodeoxyribonuclease RuvC
MRVIGVDPGSAVTGFGVVEKIAGGFHCLESGIIRTSSAATRHSRLRAIHDGLSDVIARFSPDVMSLERSFVAHNIQSAFRLGETRGVAMLVAARHGLDLAEYDPTQVKLTVAAYGRADKGQVKFMVRRTLDLDDTKELADDASDALALALCHFGHAKLAQSMIASGVESRRARAPR